MWIVETILHVVIGIVIGYFLAYKIFFESSCIGHLFIKNDDVNINWFKDSYSYKHLMKNGKTTGLFLIKKNGGKLI